MDSLYHPKIFTGIHQNFEHIVIYDFLKMHDPEQNLDVFKARRITLRAKNIHLIVRRYYEETSKV